MSTRIVTTYKTNGTGKGQIVAKGGGKQRTVSYDHAKDPRENHRHALHTLTAALGMATLPRSETVEHDNGRATFVIG